MNEKKKRGFEQIWRLVCRDKKGKVKWIEEGPNNLADEGEQQMLDVYYRNGAAPSEFYVRLCYFEPKEWYGLDGIGGEPSGNGYSPQLLERSSVGFPTIEKSISSDYSGTAQGGATNSITLASDASSNDDQYKGCVIKITGGTGAGQTRTIISYNGTSKVATVNENWAVIPDSTSEYTVFSDWRVISKTVTFSASGGTIGPVQYAFLATSSDNSGKHVAFKGLSQERTINDGESLDVQITILQQ